MSPAARVRGVAALGWAIALGVGCTAEIADVYCEVGAPPQVGCSGAALDCNCSEADGCEVDSRSDVANCGRCGRDCAGGACIEGACMPVTVAELEGEALALQVAAAGVFVALEASIVRVDPASGAMVTVTATGEQAVFAVDDAHVYWASNEEQALRRVPLGGGAAETLATVSDVGGVALDAEAVFFTDDSQVKSVPKAGGAVSSLGTFINALRGIAVDGGNAFFFRDTDNGSLFRAAKSGASSALLIGGKAIGDLAIDETRVYVTLRAEGAYGIDKTGTLGTLLAARTGAGAIAVDATDVYFSASEGAVLRVPKGGGEARTVAVDQAEVGDLALAAEAIYWTRVAPEGSALVRVIR